MPKEQVVDVSVEFMRTRDFGEVLVLTRNTEKGKLYVKASRLRQLGFNIRPSWSATRQDAECWWSAKNLLDFCAKHNLRIMNEGVLQQQ